MSKDKSSGKTGFGNPGKFITSFLEVKKKWEIIVEITKNISEIVS